MLKKMKTLTFVLLIVLMAVFFTNICYATGVNMNLNSPTSSNSNTNTNNNSSTNVNQNSSTNSNSNKNNANNNETGVTDILGSGDSTKVQSPISSTVSINTSELTLCNSLSICLIAIGIVLILLSIAILIRMKVLKDSAQQN